VPDLKNLECFVASSKPFLSANLFKLLNFVFSIILLMSWSLKFILSQSILLRNSLILNIISFGLNFKSSYLVINLGTLLKFNQDLTLISQDESNSCAPLVVIIKLFEKRESTIVLTISLPEKIFKEKLLCLWGFLTI
jgi:hypothetical protein